MKKTLLITFILTSLSSNVQAKTVKLWQFTFNPAGASYIEDGHGTIYLGKDCDAYSRKYGNGSWGWANGGWLVTFNKKKFGHGHEDPPPFDEVKGMGYGNVLAKCTI